MSIEHPIFRRATTDDVPVILAILSTHWPELATSDGMIELYRRKMSDGDRHAWVVEVDGQLLAAAVVDLNERRPVRTIETGHGVEQPDAVLEKMVVLSDAREQSIGERLQQHVLQDLASSGVGLMLLDVESTNEGAFRFWTSNGWTYIGDEQNPGPGEAYRRLCIRRLDQT